MSPSRGFYIDNQAQSLDPRLTQSVKWIDSHIKSPQMLFEGLDDKWPLITEKHTDTLDCIPRVMVILLHLSSRALISTIR